MGHQKGGHGSHSYGYGFTSSIDYSEENKRPSLNRLRPKKSVSFAEAPDSLYRSGFSSRPSRPTSTLQSSKSEHYYRASDYDSIAPPSKSDHIMRSSKPQSSGPYKHDYISGPSYKDHISPRHSAKVINNDDCFTPPRPAATRSSDYISPYEKSDHQMIKEGGWENKKQFMESHGIDPHERGSFSQARDFLNSYRRVDAEPKGFSSPASYHKRGPRAYEDRMDPDDDSDEDCIDDDYRRPGRRDTMFTPSGWAGTAAAKSPGRKEPMHAPSGWAGDDDTRSSGRRNTTYAPSEWASDEAARNSSRRPPTPSGWGGDETARRPSRRPPTPSGWGGEEAAREPSVRPPTPSGWGGDEVAREPSVRPPTPSGWGGNEAAREPSVRPPTPSGWGGDEAVRPSSVRPLTPSGWAGDEAVRPSSVRPPTPSGWAGDDGGRNYRRRDTGPAPAGWAGNDEMDSRSDDGERDHAYGHHERYRNDERVYRNEHRSHGYNHRYSHGYSHGYGHGYSHGYDREYSDDDYNYGGDMIDDSDDADERIDNGEGEDRFEDYYYEDDDGADNSRNGYYDEYDDYY
ncbi:hypothetical protein BS50DRAFT_576630 [Corynespora cassiicola Philippines]|uniref:Uncharacterized protein n=1 Tax=Corynespora cassiicola Philippines TaxID=1448308 RepID=A0A2T2NEY9_CORCC|nr:hypothetical protein BS50DRAFT_576630 [Corynespora cassiicola Philippines]